MMTGGEIFVPKIPSMRVADLAAAMAPGLDQRVIGIRPGEKLHEALITEDDSRSTLELEDRYVIEPAFAYWSRTPYSEAGARPVADGFRYTSDKNPTWLDDAGLEKMIAELTP